MRDSSNLLAHYDGENEKEQLLINHLLNTAKIASNIGKDISIGNLCFLLGVLHDSGKADIKFQTMLKNMTNSKKWVIGQKELVTSPNNSEIQMTCEALPIPQNLPM